MWYNWLFIIFVILFISTISISIAAKFLIDYCEALKYWKSQSRINDHQGSVNRVEPFPPWPELDCRLFQPNLIEVRKPANTRLTIVVE